MTTDEATPHRPGRHTSAHRIKVIAVRLAAAARTAALIYLDELREAGYFPPAIVNYYANLGYSAEGEELKSVDELIRDFSY
ncbi:MAG TPA: hypothetical protein VGE95_19815, partial [Arthrobacter sp.]